MSKRHNILPASAGKSENKQAVVCDLRSEIKGSLFESGC